MAGLERVLYVDLDVHHGNSVEGAFQSDSCVDRVSVHERGRWPYTGTVRSGASARIRNLPVATGCNDSELEYLMNAIALPFAAVAAPQVLLRMCECDLVDEEDIDSVWLMSIADQPRHGQVCEEVKLLAQVIDDG